MIKKDIPKIKGDVFLDEPLSGHTTFRIGGLCNIWAEPKDEEDIKELLKFARVKKKNVFVLGKGSNVLAREKGFNGMVIHLGSKTRLIIFSDYFESQGHKHKERFSTSLLLNEYLNRTDYFMKIM